MQPLDILSWYESMPRSIKVEAMNIAQENEQQIDNIRRIDQYYSSAHCIVCRKLTHKCKLFRSFSNIELQLTVI